MKKKLKYNFNGVHGYIDNKETIKLNDPEFIYEVSLKKEDRYLTEEELLQKYKKDALIACAIKTLIEYSDYNTVT